MDTHTRCLRCLARPGNSRIARSDYRVAGPDRQLAKPTRGCINAILLNQSNKIFLVTDLNRAIMERRTMTNPQHNISPTPLYADVVLEGGGMRGIAHVGALSVAEARGYRWQQCAGTSAGALVAA